MHEHDDDVDDEDDDEDDDDVDVDDKDGHEDGVDGDDGDDDDGDKDEKVDGSGQAMLCVGMTSLERGMTSPPTRPAVVDTSSTF